MDRTLSAVNPRAANDSAVNRARRLTPSGLAVKELIPTMWRSNSSVSGMRWLRSCVREFMAANGACGPWTGRIDSSGGLRGCDGVGSVPGGVVRLPVMLDDERVGECREAGLAAVVHDVHQQIAAVI